MHAKLQPQPHFLGENMRVEGSAREFCIFPPSRTFSVVGSLVKISKKIMREEMQTGLQCTRVLQPQPQNLQFVPHIGQICGMEESKPHFFAVAGSGIRIGLGIYRVFFSICLVFCHFSCRLLFSIKILSCLHNVWLPCFCSKFLDR